MLDYETRKKLVGERIMKERKKLGLSRVALLPLIYKSEKSHKTVAAWEKGDRLPDLESLAIMAELFKCDIGYLLGDYEESDYPKHKICEYTGLSADALVALGSALRKNNTTVNEVLQSSHFLELINYIWKSVEYAGSRGNLITMHMKQKISGNNPTIPAEDMDKIFKFGATDAAGKLYEEVSTNLYGRCADNG